MGVRPAAIWQQVRAGEVRARRESTAEGARLLVDVATPSGAGRAATGQGEMAGLVRELREEVALVVAELRAYEAEMGVVAAEREELRRQVSEAVEQVRAASIDLDETSRVVIGGGGGVAEQTQAARSGYVDVGVRLHYLEWGERGRPTVMALHELTGQADNVAALAEVLADDYHVIALDLRGHGDSEWSQGTAYRLSAFVQDVDAVIATLGFEDVALIGTGLGADVALAYAGARSDVRQLVINDSAPELEAEGLGRVAAAIHDAPRRFENGSEAARWWRQRFSAGVEFDDAELERSVMPTLRETTEGSLAWKFDAQFHFLGDVGLMRDVDLALSAERVRCPALVVRGAESDVVSHASAERLRAALGDARLVEVADVGHAPSLVESDVLPSLRELLAGTRAAR